MKRCAAMAPLTMQTQQNMFLRIDFIGGLSLGVS